MESSSNLSPVDVVQEISHQLTSTGEDLTLVRPDFPSLSESYGSEKVRDSNLKTGAAVHKGVGDAIKDLNPLNAELVLNKESLNRKKDETVGSSATEIGGSSNPKSKDWRMLFPYPIPITPQASMKFIPPADLNGNRVVDYSAVDYTAGIKRCEEYVVGFCVGKKLSFPAVKEAVTKHWKLKNEVSIKLHGNGAFVFEFKDDEDRKKVLELGSFYISKSLFTLRPWSNMIESSISSIRTIPIWVLIYGVPLHMWDNEGLSLISSFLGKPILADDCTLTRERLVYAKICVEVDVEFKYPVSILLMIDGKIALELPVEYQWKPPKCDSCMVFGHCNKSCTNIRKSRWAPPKQSRWAPLKKQVKVIEKVASKTFQRDIAGESVATEETQGITGDLIRDGGSTLAANESESTTTTGADEAAGYFDRGKNESLTKNLIKSTSNGPKVAVIKSTSKGSNSKSDGVPATEKRPKHTPFHLASDFPYQWKDLSRDNGDKDNAFSVAANDKNKDQEISVVVNPNAGRNKAADGSKEVEKPTENGTAYSSKKEGVSKSITDRISTSSGNKDLELNSGSIDGNINASDTSQGEWIPAKGKNKGVKQLISPKKIGKPATSPKKIVKPVGSPKKKPFLMLSDFKAESRFPIDSRKESSGNLTAIASSVVDRVIIEDVEEDNEHLEDCDFEKNLKFLTCEDNISKRKGRDSNRTERELHRLNWNENNGGSKNSNQETLGRGQRSQKKKGS